MDERMNENNALPAEVPAADTCADAAPQGAKMYVKPAMKVFKLDCQMLAASRMPEVYVGPLTLDYYAWRSCTWDKPGGGIMHCDEFGSYNSMSLQPCDVMGKSDPWADLVNEYETGPYHSYITGPPCLEVWMEETGLSPLNLVIYGRIDDPSEFRANPVDPSVVFSAGIDWPVSDFLLNAQLPNGCRDGAIGTYNGQEFVLKIVS